MLRHTERVRRAAGHLAGAVALLAIGVVPHAAGQSIRERSLMENPYRTPGGSCIYGAKGGLVFRPQGATCPEEQLQNAPEASASETPTPEIMQHLRELFATYPHIADEVVAAREALESGDRAKALTALEHILGEVSANKAAAERILGRMSRGAEAH
jgi:hypothetical protein